MGLAFFNGVAKVGLIGIRFSVNFSRVDKIGEQMGDSAHSARPLGDPKNSTKGFVQALFVRA
jgi:hypothetical protein